MIDPSQEISEGASHEAVPPESAAGANLQSPAPLTPINAIEPSALSDAVPESKNPMLDVHAPHGSVHTWKDFFIHLATIAIGLLIAIGLEQTVEFFHHRHQLKEAREQLATERDGNRDVLAKNLDCVRTIQTRLDR